MKKLKLLNFHQMEIEKQNQSLLKGGGCGCVCVGYSHTCGCGPDTGQLHTDNYMQSDIDTTEPAGSDNARSIQISKG